MNEKLLACKIKPYTIELDEGQIVNVKDEVWVGCWNRRGEFCAVCFDRIEDGRLVGGDSITVTKEEFDEKVEKEIDIFEGEQQAKEIIEKLLNAFASNDFFTEEELSVMHEAEEFLGE